MKGFPPFRQPPSYPWDSPAIESVENRCLLLLLVYTPLCLVTLSCGELAGRLALAPLRVSQDAALRLLASGLLGDHIRLSVSHRLGLGLDEVPDLLGCDVRRDEFAGGVHAQAIMGEPESKRAQHRLGERRVGDEVECVRGQGAVCMGDAGSLHLPELTRVIGRFSSREKSSPRRPRM